MEPVKELQVIPDVNMSRLALNTDKYWMSTTNVAKLSSLLVLKS